MRKNLFKYELLERCEKSFTQAPCEDFTGLSEEEIEQKKSLAKKKTLGNVRFIGELFKVELITSKVILSCVDELITKSSQDEGNLEGACILLSTGGLSFERPKLVKETDRIFKILEEIMKKNTLSTKIKFKIMDLVDERTRSWKKNFKEEVKTVQEIHQEFEIELQKKKRMN
jgi:translation initiation factor 4G